jgi:catechol 2,3-dioxygenase-like lactoylglutathione lyase family enzyme
VKILAAFPKLLVRDVPASLRFYQEVLGFACAATFGDPPAFAIVERDGFGIHLKQGLPRPRRDESEAWDIYLEVADLDAFVVELREHGARLLRGPAVQEYGMTELDVVDPDGYIICIAEDAAGR